jgi:16S rRNA (cytidine1402-2'-O)-methyltransferase
MPGRLVVCATPIGNLRDVTVRVLDALREADAIAAEDTRITSRLLARYEIAAPLERYDEHVAEARTPRIVERVLAGETIALVSDAGTPGVSDPGARLVDACIEAGAPVEVLPGPSAIVTALVASGLPTHAFYFGGFLPRKSGERKARLGRIAGLDATLIFYESPRRAASALEFLAEMLPGRRAAMARELTKVHEEVVRGPIADVATEVASRLELKGEVVLLVGPPGPEIPALPDAPAVRKRVRELRSQGVSARDAVKMVAEETGASRNAIYEIAHAREE